MARKSKKPRPGVPGSTPAYSPFVQSPSPVISRAPAPTPATPALPIPALPAPLVPPAKPAPAAPSPQPVNLDFLIAGFGLKALNDNGMINYPDAPANDIGPAWPTGEVHPVFARKNWLGLGDADWAHLQTALKLATCFLYDPAIITYFTSLLNLTPLPDPGNKQKNKLKQDLFSFGHDRTIHDADTIMAFKRMAEMRDRVTWEFTTHQPGANRSLPKNAWGITYPCHAGYGAITHLRKTSSSEILLDNRFLTVLRGTISASNAQQVKKELSPYDQTSALLRTHFRLAILLLHEFTHAFRLATFQKNPSTRSHDNNLAAKRVKDCEPFFRDHRIAELGCAFEEVVLGGLIEALGPQPPNPHPAVPYGFGAVTFPGIMTTKGVAKDEGLPASDELRGVLMRDVRRFYTREFWERRAVQFGLKAFELDRGHVVKVVSRRGEKLWWP